MAKKFIRLKLTSGQRCRNIESDKSYAINSGFKSWTFLPRSKCNLFELDLDQMPYRWIIEIPEWLTIDNQDLQYAIKQITKENEERQPNT